MTLTKIILLTAQFAFAAMLVWACFCRMVKTNDRTEREVRWSIWMLCVAGMLVFAAPLLPLLVPELAGRGAGRWRAWSTPHWVWLVLLIGATAVHLAASKYWRYGVPEDFQEYRA